LFSLGFFLGIKLRDCRHLFAVQAGFGDFFADFVGYEIADGQAVADAPADEGSGDVHQGGVEKADGWVVAKGAVGIAGAVIYVDLVVAEENVVIFPLGERTQVVTAHDEDKLAVGVFFPQVDECVNGIGRDGQGKFDIADVEFGIVFGGQAGQVKAVVVIGERGLFFEGIAGGDDQPHLFQVGSCGHVLGDDEVAGVDGIEGTEKQACLFVFFHIGQTDLGGGGFNGPEKMR